MIHVPIVLSTKQHLNCILTNSMLEASKVKRLTLRIFSWSLLLIIFCGMLYKVGSCLEKFVQEPKGVEISTKSQDGFEFPAVTFCPLASSIDSNYGEFDPKPYNWTWLKSCGLTKEFKENGQFVGIGSDDCKDSVKLWKKAIPRLKDFGIEEVQAQTIKSEMKWRTISKDSSNWRQTLSDTFGSCYSLIIPNEITQEMIRYVYIRIQKGKTFNVILHSNGLLNPMNPWWTIEMNYNVFAGKRVTYEVTYTHEKVLDFDGNQCNADPNYDYSSCKMNFSIQATLEKVGCLTPFQNQNEKICTNPENARLAYEVYSKSMMNHSCMYPCQHLSSLTINRVKEMGGSAGVLWLGFRKYIQVHESKLIYTALDLFAAVGGYVGLFMGISLLHFRDVLVKFLQKLCF